MNRNIREYHRQFFRGNHFPLILAAGHTLLLTATNLLISWLLQQIIDLTTGAATGFTFGQLVLLAALAIALVPLTFVFAYFSIPRFVSKAMGQYQNYVFEKLSQKSIAAFGRENTSVYISALSNDANTIEKNYLSNIFRILNAGALFLGSLALMFYYSPLLTLISIVLSLLPLLACLITGSRATAAETQVSLRNESYMSTLKDSLVGFSVVKAFQAEAQMCRIFSENVARVMEAKCTRQKVSLLVQMLSLAAGVIVQLGVFLVGAYLALTGYGVSAGTVLVFVQLLNYIISPLGEIPQCLVECKAAIALIQKLADSLSQNVRQDGKAVPSQLREGIEVRALSFGYGEAQPVLRNVNFRFGAGKSYAIVGTSGSGKSTLLNLLMAAHGDYAGSILYDGVEVREISTRSLYALASLIQQNVFLFNASIHDNITMFRDFPEAEVEQAIALSGLSALIEERGGDYLCGENGSNISGGEKQRVSIARSLLRKASVLLVDEATAALDTQTAYQVSSSILALSGITRIVVTHTLDEALLRQYDCILTLRSGTVQESGTFDDLMAQKGYFYSLFTVSQA